MINLLKTAVRCRDVNPGRHACNVSMGRTMTFILVQYFPNLPNNETLIQ